MKWLFASVVSPIEVFAVLFAGLAIGWSIGTRSAHQEAVEAGAGRYICNPSTGIKKFEFIHPSETPVRPDSSEEQASDDSHSN